MRPSSAKEETPMARTSPRERPDQETVLWPIQKDCPACGFPMRVRYENRRTVVTLSGTQRLCLKIRRCEQVGCARQDRPYRPEAEGAIALAHDELVATAVTDSGRLGALLAAQGRVILALDGLQPDVGHEVLWVVRDCLSGQVLLARSLLSGTAADLEPLLREVAAAVGVPVLGVVSDGQTSIRRAVERALPGVPHQLCQFHFLREAALPVFEADRHAKVQLKAQIRGVRRLERAVEDRDDAGSQVMRGYCAAVRSAITEAGRAPLAASGLALKGRLTKGAASLERATAKGGRIRRRSWRDCAG